MAGQEQEGRPDGLLVIQENEFRNREFAKVTDSTSQCLDFLKDYIPTKPMLENTWPLTQINF